MPEDIRWCQRGTGCGAPRARNPCDPARGVAARWTRRDAHRDGTPRVNTTELNGENGAGKVVSRLCRDGRGRAEGGRVAQSEMDQNLLDDFELLNGRDNPPGAARLGAQQGIGLKNVFDQPSPLLLESPSGRRSQGFDKRVWCSARPLAL